MSDLRETLARALCNADDFDANNRDNIKRYRSDAAAALSAINAAGYVVVPREPTEAMKEAGFRIFKTKEEAYDGHDYVEVAYRAMIEASQKDTEA